MILPPFEISSVPRWDSLLINVTWKFCWLTYPTGQTAYHQSNNNNINNLVTDFTLLWSSVRAHWSLTHHAVALVALAHHGNGGLPLVMLAASLRRVVMRRCCLLVHHGDYNVHGKHCFLKGCDSSLPTLFGSKLKPSTNMHPDNSVNFPQGEMFSYSMYLTLLHCNPERMLLYGQFLPFASVTHLKIHLDLITISLFKIM